VSEAETSRDLTDSVKSVHRSFPTGVTIVTTSDGGEPFGLAVNAFSSVALEPPMVMVCVAATSSTYPRLFRDDRIAINILASDQEHVARQFGARGADKFAGITWHHGANTAPVLDAASAHLEVDIVSRIPAGTHTIFLGKVTAAKATGKPPLVYFNSSFFDGTWLADTLAARDR
jgi:flavin reductase (DIM6/NTAB) family NADH-FMN oxidoreductase RutF